MHPWERPAAYHTFADESATLLAALRLDVARNNGRAHHDFFVRRALWTWSWRVSGTPRGVHRDTLTGAARHFAKCVWCEQYRESKRELDVEHYRPKVAVTEWEGDVPIIPETPPREVNERGGYWWLAFAWSNLALSCKTCNEGWKRNLFPVRSRRVADVREGDETRDAPLLLDPSQPLRMRDHLRWTPDGIIEPISDEGRATIITCGLNRSELLQRRAQAAQNVLSHRWRLLQAIRGRDAVARRAAWASLDELCSITAEFTGMARWFVEEGLGRAWDELPDLS